MSVDEGVRQAGQLVEALGVGVLVAGVVAVLLWAVYGLATDVTWQETYRRTRSGLGRVLLLGLEILVAGDIIATVAVEPTLNTVGVLAAIVVIRTFLSWSIEMETEGRLPWRASNGGSAPSATD